MVIKKNADRVENSLVPRIQKNADRVGFSLVPRTHTVLFSQQKRFLSRFPTTRYDAFEGIAVTIRFLAHTACAMVPGHFHVALLAE